MAVISDSTRRRKIPFASQYLFPQLAIVDPELIFTLPAQITAATGMDALTHAIEALTTLVEEPVADAIALDAVERINTHLPRAFSEGDAVESRVQMALASTAERGIERIRELNAQLAIPAKLTAFGITQNDQSAIAQAALEDGSILFNPRPVDFDSMVGLIQKLL